MNKTPWDHQQKAFDDIIKELDTGTRSIICQLATRAGKSIIATMLIEHFHGEPIYFIGHKKILVTQMSEELTDNGTRHGIIAPWAPRIKYRVQVISKDTFYNRFKSMKTTGWKPPRLMIIDECHMAMGNRYKEIIEHYSESIVIGLTATPLRLDGKGLGVLFEKIVVGPSMKELQRKKRLCPIDTLIADFDDSGLKVGSNGDYTGKSVLEKVDKPAVLQEIVKHWEDHAKGKKTLTFCASIQHTEDMASEFTEAGYPSIALSSKDSPQVINAQLKKYYSGEYINLCSVDLFTMGLNVKACECIIQARPTQSLMIYLQSLGRGMIWIEGKILINLDCVNNYDRHGLPDDERIWSLDGDNGKLKDPTTLKKCPSCYRPVPMSARTCEHCGHSWVESSVVGSRMPEQKSGRLIRIEKNDLILRVAREASTFQEAVSIAGDQAEGIWKQLRLTM